MLLQVLSLILLLCLNVSAQTTIVTGSNFDLYYPSGNTLAFQHLGTPYVKAFIASVKVELGTLNGTNGHLSMQLDSGDMTFLSQDTATLTPSEAMAIFVNDERGNTIKNGDNVKLVWANPFVYGPILPIMFILGMFGLGSMFGGPVYGIYKVKHGEYYEGFRTSLIVTVLGIALFIAWLWAG